MIAVGSPRVVKADGLVSVRFALQAPAWVGMQRDELVVMYPQYPQAWAPDNDALGGVAVLSLLPFAFWAGAHLGLADALPLDDDVRQNAMELCRLWSAWFRRPIALRIGGGAAAGSPPVAGGQTALLFSGGVDSMATYLNHRDEVDALVFVRGADLYLREGRIDVESKYRRILSRLQDFAEAEGKQFVALTTNVRHVFGLRRRGEMWYWVAHGCATAAPMLALSPQFSRLLIASNGTGRYCRIITNGTHPAVIHQLSNRRQAVGMPDRLATRHKRCQPIMSNRRALAALRVCSEEGPAYNCGHCEKCKRTIASLLLLGVEPGEASFPPETFQWEHVCSQWAGRRMSFGVMILWCELLQALEEAPRTPLGGQALAVILRQRLSFYARYCRGDLPGPDEPIIPVLPARPNLIHRLVGFPALNHGSFTKWLKNGARARLSRSGVLVLLRSRWNTRPGRSRHGAPRPR